MARLFTPPTSAVTAGCREACVGLFVPGWGCLLVPLEKRGHWVSVSLEEWLGGGCILKSRRTRVWKGFRVQLEMREGSV